MQVKSKVQSLKFDDQGLGIRVPGSGFWVPAWFKHFIVLLLLLFQTLNLLSQIDSTISHTRINGKYLVSYWTETKIIVASPFHWKGKQWLTFTGVVGATALLYVYDDPIFNAFQANRTTVKDDISKYLIEPWGSGMYSLPLLAGIYLTGKKNSRHRTIALTGVKAFLLSGGAAFILKHAFHRHRPYEDSPPDPNQWEGPYPFTSSYTSFPSGHTITAFAIASVLAHGYKDKLWIVLSSYSVATLVGVSRIYDGKHWASDVMTGAALGTFIGTTLSKVNLKKVDLYPTSYMGTYGIGATFKIQ